ncbi:hypothetical protein KR009_009015, partial [Drosophila setifemur]
TQFDVEIRGSEVGVLAPTQDAKLRDENKDANSGMGIANTGTPVARKTRRATRQPETFEKESPTNPGPSKTPGTPSSRFVANETPRRSCRKSVRPMIDYSDIVRSAKKVVLEVNPPEDENNESEAQKWTVAEVGRISRKRNRKSKRTANKRQKVEQEPKNTEVAEDTEVLEKEVKKSEINKDNKVELEKIKEKPAYTEDKEEEEKVVDKPTKIVQKKSLSTGKQRDAKAALIEEIKITKALCKVSDEDIDELGLYPLSQGSNDGNTEEITPKSDQDELMEVEINNENEDPEIEKSANTTFERNCDEDPEEMPSLIMVDEEDPVESEKSQLNTTFDAENSVILVEVPEFKASGSQVLVQKPSIKVVLTTEEDKDQSLLTAECSSPLIRKSGRKQLKGYQFPTPFKSKPSFRFLSSHKTANDDIPEPEECSSGLGTYFMEEPKNKRRRSKSASQWNDVFSKTVSFQSPVEILHVGDIDKRWEGLNNSSRFQLWREVTKVTNYEYFTFSDVTNRRKRSKSWDENRCKASRIPQPKVVAVNKIITPSKVKRTKLPNFAALHEKLVSKMEGLSDYVERKAERAKVLQNSAIKQPLGSAAKKIQASTLDSDRIRPRALKKFDLVAERSVTVVNSALKPLPSRLPLKASSNVAVATRPAFNLSTTMVKTFNATIASGSTAHQSNKVAERKQRHMEMFKGRSNKEKNEKGEFIKGVRLNRRFELQMQHRRHIAED